MSTTPAQGNIFIVGLAGPSGSGKSTVAKRVASRLNGHVISMEIYSRGSLRRSRSCTESIPSDGMLEKSPNP
jgi:uridine kinase